MVTELRRLRVGPADFEVRKTIGRGHFGQVHVVHERRSGDVFAMKTLRKQDTLAQTGVSRFHRLPGSQPALDNGWLLYEHECIFMKSGFNCVSVYCFVVCFINEIRLK